MLCFAIVTSAQCCAHYTDYMRAWAAYICHVCIHGVMTAVGSILAESHSMSYGSCSGQSRDFVDNFPPFKKFFLPYAMAPNSTRTHSHRHRHRHTQTHTHTHTLVHLTATLIMILLRVFSIKLVNEKVWDCNWESLSFLFFQNGKRYVKYVQSKQEMLKQMHKFILLKNPQDIRAVL